MGKPNFTKENARENQQKGLAVRRANKEAGREDVSRFVNKEMVDLLFVLPIKEAMDRLEHPKTVVEQIVSSRINNDKMNWEMVQDVMDRILGKPRQQVDASIDGKMNIILDTTGLYGEQSDK